MNEAIACLNERLDKKREQLTNNLSAKEHLENRLHEMQIENDNLAIEIKELASAIRSLTASIRRKK